MQQARLSATEKAFIQRRVEALHTMMPSPVSQWLKARNAGEEGLCALDTAAIVTPPQGLEFGFVPIVLYEGIDQPPHCDEVLTPPPLPPAPPPAPAPKCQAPHPLTCEEKCVEDGHCCVGSTSSYQTTSCAQGCIVAKQVNSVIDCQAVCRANDKTCSWTLPAKGGGGGPGISMKNCASCPAGCDASDGPYECEAGCEFAFGSSSKPLE